MTDVVDRLQAVLALVTLCDMVLGEDAKDRTDKALIEGVGNLIRVNAGQVAALREIAKGEGEFNLDPLEHAKNTIDNMQRIAFHVLPILPTAEMEAVIHYAGHRGGCG